MGTYYPENPSPERVTSIRSELARQWACIDREWTCKAAGRTWNTRNSWEPDRPPEAVLAILEGPLAWRRLPPLSAFDPGADYAPYLWPWTNRPDGLYWTLSPEGATKLGVRPVGLTSKRRALAVSQGETDARGDILSGETALMDGQWMPMLRIGQSVPLFRWTRDQNTMAGWMVNPQHFDGVAIDSLNQIGTDRIADECCQHEKEKVFTRKTNVKTDEIGRMIRQAAG